MPAPGPDVPLISLAAGVRLSDFASLPRVSDARRQKHSECRKGSYGFGLFLEAFLDLSLSSLSTPVSRSLFTPGLGGGRPSCFTSLTGDGGCPLSSDGGVLSGSDLIGADAVGSSGGIVDVDRDDFFGWVGLRIVCS